MARESSLARLPRRALLTLPLAVALALARPSVQAQTPAATAPPAAPAVALSIRTLGVFALLGESLQLVFPADVTDTRLDRNLRETLPVKDIGFDQAALRAVREVMGRLQPAATLQMYRATTPLTPAEQRDLADGATRAELPDWIVKTIQSAGLSHLLLITRHRGEASFPLLNGFSIGRGNVEGVGYYVDSTTEMKNLITGRPSTGFLGAYVMLRLLLVDARSGDVVGSQDVRIGEVHAGRNDTEAANIWNALDPREKVEVLRRMVEQSVTRVMPAVLSRG